MGRSLPKQAKKPVRFLDSEDGVASRIGGAYVAHLERQTPVTGYPSLHLEEQQSYWPARDRTTILKNIF